VLFYSKCLAEMDRVSGLVHPIAAYAPESLRHRKRSDREPPGFRRTAHQAQQKRKLIWLEPGHLPLVLLAQGLVPVLLQLVPLCRRPEH
jgi:hypothetical protein